MSPYSREDKLRQLEMALFNAKSALEVIFGNRQANFLTEHLSGS